MSPDAMALEERQPQFIRLIICLLLSLIKITWVFFFFLFVFLQSA